MNSLCRQVAPGIQQKRCIRHASLMSWWMKGITSGYRSVQKCSCSFLQSNSSRIWTCFFRFPGWLWSSTWWAPSWWPVWGWSSRTWRRIALGIIGDGNEKRSKSNGCSFDTGSDSKICVFCMRMCLGGAQRKLASIHSLSLVITVWWHLGAWCKSQKHVLCLLNCYPHHIHIIKPMQEQHKCVFNSSFDQKVEYHGISMIDIYLWYFDIFWYMLVEYMAIYIDIYGLIPPKIYSSATETPPGRDDGRHYRAKVRWMDGKSFFFPVTAT